MQLKNPEVRIETTNRCNSHCVMCPRDQMTRPLSLMEFRNFKKLVCEAKRLGAETISLFGFGEPLLDPSISEKVMMVSLLGMKPILTTNASLLTPKMTHNLLDAGLAEIRFSVHGLGNTYNKTHSGLNWHKTMININHFLAMNIGQCVTNVSVIPMHKESVEEIRDFWEFQVDYLEIWRPHDWVDTKKYRTHDRRLKTCGRPHRGPVQINADGKMMVCCFDFDAQMTVGDTNKVSIEEILKGDEFNKIRDRHESGDLNGLPCASCDQLNIYTEEDYPLLYSNRDSGINKTSSTKFQLREN